MRNPNTKPRESNPFGIMLRARRTGFGFSDVHGAYIRVGWLNEENGLANIEVCPPSKIMDITSGGNRKKLKYIGWMDNPDTGMELDREDPQREKFLSLVPIPRKRYTIYETFQVNVDEEAENGH